MYSIFGYFGLLGNMPTTPGMDTPCAWHSSALDAQAQALARLRIMWVLLTHGNYINSPVQLWPPGLNVRGISYGPLVWVPTFVRGICGTGVFFVGGLSWCVNGPTRIPNQWPILEDHTVENGISA